MTVDYGLSTLNYTTLEHYTKYLKKMENKKNPSVDLNRKRGLFFTLGLIITCTLVISAFEWKTFTEQDQIELTAEVEEEVFLDIPNTVHTPPPPPPKVQPIEVVELPDDVEDTFDNFDFPELDDPIEATTVTIPKPKKPVPIKDEEIKDTILLFTEFPAKPKNGYKAFYQYIADHMQYPSTARRMGVEGRVYLQFVIEKDGSLTDIKVIKGIGSGCDQEAILVLKDAPKWTPGRQRG